MTSTTQLASTIKDRLYVTRWFYRRYPSRDNALSLDVPVTDWQPGDSLTDLENPYEIVLLGGVNKSLLITLSNNAMMFGMRFSFPNSFQDCSDSRTELIIGTIKWAMPKTDTNMANWLVRYAITIHWGRWRIYCTCPTTIYLSRWCLLVRNGGKLGAIK